jgi:hypothetical protein
MLHFLALYLVCNFEIEQIIGRQMVRVFVGNKLEGVWKEATLTCFKAQSWHLPGRTVENHEKYVGTASFKAES